ncbi:MAG TPA: shikimate dehydrogenase [Blastocatellia bacterium]|nr:shikimate dehydrogenase [Blastocatellia bacterium]
MDERRAIAVPIAHTSVEKVIAACSAAEKVADWIELRLDYLEEVTRDFIGSIVRSFAQLTRKPMIFTYRPITDGGRAPADLGHRTDIWRAIFSSVQRQENQSNILFDLELDLAEHLAQHAMLCPWTQVIASFHAFDSLPDELETIYLRMAASPARILKIAVQANDVHQVASIFRLLERARRDRRALVALAMGMPGIISRILGPAYGSLLTFGALSSDGRTAPGQPLVRHLKEIYRVNQLSRSTAVYGVVGKPIGHSLSPLIHNAWIHQAGCDAVYVPFEVSDLQTFIREIVLPGSRRVPWQVKGLSVTLPHKVAIVDHLDAIDPLASRVGAVNTVVVQRGNLIGFNTDVTGLLQPLLSRMDVKNARVIIVGTGGAARAAAVGLAERGARLRIVGRNEKHIRALTEQVGAEASFVHELPTLSGDILIHATPVGMAGYQAGAIIPTETLEKVRLVYDLVYNPIETDLLRRAREVGCDTLSGLEMFLHQAAEQFFLWFGSRPSIERGETIAQVELQHS